VIELLLSKGNYPQDASLDRVQAISQFKGIGNIVVMPDVHYKSKYPAPTGIVVASKEMIMPPLIAIIINCGMRIITTPLRLSDLGDKAIDQIYGKIMSRIPIYPPKHPVLSRKDVCDILVEGSAWALRKFDIEASELDAIEQRGQMFDLNRVDRSDVLRAVPLTSIKVGELGLDYMGGGAHFIELQVVKNILNAETAQKFGLEEDQLIFMLHSDAGLVGGTVNQYFGFNRIKSASHMNELKFSVRKWQYHLNSFGSFMNVPKIYRDVFRQGILGGFHRDSVMGKRYKFASYAASNFGYVKRMALTEHVRSAVREVVGDRHLDMPLLYDVSHNEIKEETIHGESYWVHRHGCCKALPPSQMLDHPVFRETGQPFPFPGSMATSSYICVGDEGSKRTYYSASHGSGNITAKTDEKPSDQEILSHLQKKGIKLFKGGRAKLIKHAPHRFNDPSIIIKELEKYQIAKPVVQVFPVAVLKE